MFPGKLPGHAALLGGLIEAVQSVCQGLAGAGDVDALVAGTGRAEVGAVVQVEHALVGEEHLHVCVAHAEAAEVAPDQVGALQLGDHNSGEVLGEEVADILADYCAQLLRGEHRLEPEHITRIVDHTYQVAVNTVDNPEPSTPYGYKFSGQYCTAAMLVYGHLGESAFTPEATSDPRVRRLMDKITLVCDPELEASYQADRNRWAHRLEVTLEDGRVLTRQVEYPYGDFNNPFTWAYEHEKFHTLADGVLGPDRVAALVERLPHLEELDDINRLFEGL